MSTRPDWLNASFGLHDGSSREDVLRSIAQLDRTPTLAQLREALVRLDSAFAKSIEPGASYRVFVTANGDTNGLFVASKSASGFVVHDNRGGRSTVSFDYRIVATALGQTGQRMALRDRAAVMPHVPANHR